MNNITPFNFESQQIRVVEIDNEPWFIAKDVCDILEHSNSRVALSRLDEDEKGVSKVYTLGGKQEILAINESGLYSLILTSNKPQAKKFKKWVTSEVLPSIRRTGSYSNHNIPSSFIPLSKEAQAMGKIAMACGLKGNQRALYVNKAVQRLTGVNLLAFG